MEQSPSSEGSHENYPPFMEPEGSLLSHTNPINIFEPYFPKILFNIILPSMPRSSEWSLPFRLSNQNFARISHLLPARYMPRPSQPPSFDHPNIIW
jgi:hypothetical protein